MSKLLFIVGGVLVFIGIVMAGYGIPVIDFGFGNTLIMAGATATVGGFIVIALGAVVSQLQHIAAFMTERIERETRSQISSSHVAFPQKSTVDSDVTRSIVTSRTDNLSTDNGEGAFFTPTLPNPDELPKTLTEKSLSQPNRPGQRKPASIPEQERGAAILKSGVVDGMAYTLYVDGSIEAELPHGTLRFASISELRSHLEKGA